MRLKKFERKNTKFEEKLNQIIKKKLKVQKTVACKKIIRKFNITANINKFLLCEEFAISIP